LQFSFACGHKIIHLECFVLKKQFFESTPLKKTEYRRVSKWQVADFSVCLSSMAHPSNSTLLWGTGNPPPPVPNSKLKIQINAEQQEERLQ